MPFTLQRLARDVIELIDHLGVDRIHLAGSSAGAIISMKVAIDHPERVKTLANFASTPGLGPSNVDAEKWVAHIQRRGVRGFLSETIADRFDLAAVDPRFVEWFLDESAKTSAAWLARFVPLMRSVDLTQDLGRIRCPMLTVVPDHDPISSMAQYEVIRDRVPNVKFVVYHGLPPQHHRRGARPLRRGAAPLPAGAALRGSMPHGGLPEVGLVAHGVPGRAIFVTVLAVNALGDYLRDALGPRLQKRV